MRFIDSSIKNMDSDGSLERAHSESVEYRANQFRIYQVTRSSFYENNPLINASSSSSHFENDGSKEFMIEGTNALKLSRQKDVTMNHQRSQPLNAAQASQYSWQQQSEQLHKEWQHQQQLKQKTEKEVIDDKPTNNVVSSSLPLQKKNDECVPTKVDINNRW